MDYAFQCLINRLSDKLLSAIYFNFLSTRIFMISIRNLQKFQRFSDCREWQEIDRQESVKSGAIFEHILNFAGV